MFLPSRTELNGTSYGFDFVLFDEIESCRVMKEPDFIIINLTKIKKSIWPRLLTSMNKVRNNRIRKFFY